MTVTTRIVCKISSTYHCFGRMLTFCLTVGLHVNASDSFCSVEEAETTNQNRTEEKKGPRDRQLYPSIIKFL